MYTIIAANWKMNKTRIEARKTTEELARLLYKVPLGTQVLVFAPFTALDTARMGVGDRTDIAIGAQDVYPAKSGAFTGEISPDMIRDAGATWVLTGHSERRHILGESDALVAEKTAFALTEDLSVMLCVGETLLEREAGLLETVLRRQLATALHKAAPLVETNRFAIAYEPVWAIGTGKVASPADVLEAHALLRRLLGEHLDSHAAHIALLYGGSVTPDNAPTLLGLDNVNGLLVGGASLRADSFARIVRP